MTTVAATLRAHLQTWRPYTLWYVGLVGLAGAGLAGGEAERWRLVAAWVTPTIGWIGGHYLGDYFDRRLDVITKPHRPIPSGRMAASTALGCGVGCVVAVVALAIAGGWRTTTVAALAVLGIVAYSRGLKARGLAGNLARGALGGLVLLYGAALVGPPIPWSLAGFVLAFWAHDTSSNLVGTLRDIAGDRAGGYRTLPVRRGTRVAVLTARRLYAVSLTGAVAGGWLTVRDAVSGSARTGYFAALAVAAGLAVLAFRALPPDQPRIPGPTALRVHELLVLERVWFAAAVVGLGLGPVPALLLVGPALVVTWWTQARMRSDYEFGAALPPPSTHRPPPVNGAAGPAIGSPVTARIAPPRPAVPPPPAVPAGPLGPAGDRQPPDPGWRDSP